jgi:hypothetical protein
LQGLDSRRAVIRGQSPEVRSRAEQPVPSAQIVGGTRKAANALGQEQMRFVAAATAGADRPCWLQPGPVPVIRRASTFHRQSILSHCYWMKGRAAQRGGASSPPKHEWANRALIAARKGSDYRRVCSDEDTNHVPAGNCGCAPSTTGAPQGRPRSQARTIVAALRALKAGAERMAASAGLACD